MSLIASLLDAREPVPVTTIRGWFPEDYGCVSDEAFERKFERDKADIVELGIPLSFVQGLEHSDDGYVVDRTEVYLPDLDFDAEELATLYIAGKGLLSQEEFPYHRDLARALDKIALRAEPDRMARARLAARRVLLNHPVQQPHAGLDARLELVSHAVSKRLPLQLVYHTLYSGEVTERRVDPYGLRCWQGRWGMVGYCHQRQEVRVFTLHRIRELELAADATPFEVPEGFSIAAWQMQPPWRYQLHAPLRVRLDVDAERAWFVAEQLGAAPGPVENGRTTVDIEVTNADGLVEWVLRQGPNLCVVSPPELRERVKVALQGVVALYEGAAP